MLDFRSGNSLQTESKVSRQLPHTQDFLGWGTVLSDWDVQVLYNNRAQCFIMLCREIHGEDST